MSDHRRHRGPHPKDRSLFEGQWHIPLASAAADLIWLLDKGYAVNSSLKLVGDRYGLKDRQRTAVSRVTCTSSQKQSRAARRTLLERCSAPELWIDGYNLLTTVEAAIAGGVLLVGFDGSYRDMASMHGTWRRVEETEAALRMIGDYIDQRYSGLVHWWLDAPVSNSGRLASLLREIAAEQAWLWKVDLVPDPDAVLKQDRFDVVTADSAILDQCGHWVNLACELLNDSAEEYWRLDLFGDPARDRTQDAGNRE